MPNQRLPPRLLKFEIYSLKMSRSNVPCDARLQISQAREGGEFSDLTFICEGQKIFAHKIIVCPQSPVIKKACTGPYEEQESGIYEIKDSSFDVVQQMVQYLYTGQYGVPTETEENGQIASPLSFHATMFGVADKYMINGLQVLSRAKFEKFATCEGDVCATLRSIADVYSLQCESSKALRDIVVDTLRDRISRSLNSDEQDTLDRVTDQVPEFTKDLLHSFLRHPILGHCSYCSSTKLVPVVPLQSKCKKCGRGGGTWETGGTWKTW